MKQLYICGCSHATGYYSLKNGKPIQSGFNTPYTKLIAEKLSMNPVMLAHAGASNYFIIKQIEYAIEQKAEYILFNVTTPARFDWVTGHEMLTSLPRFEDFICKYNEANTSSRIRSDAFMTIIHNPREGTEDLSRFVAKYVDRKIRLDQDRLMLGTIFAELDKLKIKYLAVDCADNEFTKLPTVSAFENMIWTDVVKTLHADTDKIHLSQHGHQMIADYLIEQVKTAFSI